MVVVKCPIPDCDFETNHEDANVVVALLNIHALSHTQSTNRSAAPQPKLDRPRIEMGVEEEVWNGFVRRWEAFRVGSGINDSTAPMQLFQCASESLGDLVLKAHPDIQSKSVKDVKATLREFAVIPVAIGVRRAELMDLKQAPDEPFRTFAAKVKGKAETCIFTTTAKCSCHNIVQADYTVESVRDVLLAGIADIDIRREALSTADMQKKGINDVIAFVESREMARNATPVSNTLSALSTFKRKQTLDVNPKKSSSDSNKTLPCPDCGKKFSTFKQNVNGQWNTIPHKKCLNCWRSNRPKSSQNFQNNAISAEDSDLAPAVQQVGVIESVLMTKEIISKSDLKRQKHSDHPRVSFDICKNTSKNNVHATVSGIVDSGAMSNLWGLKDFLKCGFSMSDLIKVNMDIRAANKNPINIVGALKATITSKTPSDNTISCHCLVYISDSVNDFFLSYDSMLDLGIINKAFPTIGAHIDSHIDSSAKKPKVEEEQQQLYVRSLNSGCTGTQEGKSSCTCPQRTSVPNKPEKLPFDPTPENNGKMRDWLLERYKSSTFNTCPHRPLPCMSGPPIEIHMKETAIPKTCHIAADIPTNWRDQVEKDLMRDEALGVIEKVPYGEPVTWCHRMVVTRKHNGDPRRTVDLSPLNKFCKRETFSSDSPFKIARRIPSKSWKTVTDAWNGYHSVPLRESDRHLTTFITPFGRYRYTRAPQGFLSSGDGYNRRFDAILSTFEKKERCVDDTCHFDNLNDLEGHWRRTIDFLSTCGAAGIVLNPDKFQFAQIEIDFAGFRISEDKINPLPKYIEAIRSFPTPTSTTDVRSWFGLINQVANYAQLREPLKLFRPFLSPKHKFLWDHTLDKAFEKSKEVIIDAIHHGVEIYDINKPTCLRPDWSKEGIGYFLLQKHCKCESHMPDCCKEGWKITLAGSRFLNGAEERYAAIEGEALAIAWSLEQTKYFTQGCQYLTVVTDHKPLLKIFGDRTLDEIPNTRLFRLKQRTLPWHFQIEHMPGTTNSVADAMSRHPTPNLDTNEFEEISESMISSSICRELEDKTTISWECIASETGKDQTMSSLIKALSDPYRDQWKETPLFHEYGKYFDTLYILEGVIMYQDRVVVPPTLRKTIVESLHAAHQGTASMERRAKSIIFWPGMTNDIHQVRARCIQCNTNAPSQAQLPSTPARPPSTPFDQIFADFFDSGGHHYLVVGDRLSGWPEVYSTPSGSANAGAKGLIACLRKFIATFGVPEELSSDGGPEFSASETKNFLTRWGIHHRKSSAYHPQSNGRAEVAVKSVKRLLRSNVTQSGSLDSDKFLRGLLQLRNTPDPDCNLSPSEIIFGRPIKDAFSFANKLEKFSNRSIQPIWREAWKAKEVALKTRFVQTSEKLNQHAKHLTKLEVGDRCFVQNQAGNHPKRWDRTGIIVDSGPNDQYTVKVDGSGRATMRNRRFLRKFEPASMMIQAAPSSAKDIPPFTTDKDLNQNGYTPLVSDHAKYQDTPKQSKDFPIVPSQTEDIPFCPPQHTEPAASTPPQ